MNENSKMVSHEGFITAIEGKKAQVSVLVKSACGDCQIKGACNLAEMQNKIIEADTGNKTFALNEKVLVKMKESLGLKAVFLAYIIPVILIIIVLIAASQLSENDNISALAAIVIASAYYLVLYFFRNKVKKAFSFSVHKLNE